MKLLFWRKESEVTDGAYAPYEEIDAKRTSKLGYFFLVLMVIFGVWQGNNLLSSIQETVDRPLPNTRCTEELAGYLNDNTIYTTSYYGYYSYENNGCQFTARELELNLHTLYTQAKPWLQELSTRNEEISRLNRAIEDTEYRRRTTIDEYQAALVEDIANKSVRPQGNVLSTSGAGSGILNTEDDLRTYRSQLAAAEITKASLEQKIRTLVNNNASVLKAVAAAYEKEMKLYELAIFLVSVILIVPLFYFSWRKYSAARERRSEYAIIWGGVVATFGIMTAQVLLVFVYEILPHQILEAIFTFLSGFAVLWTLLYWLAFILVPAFFGFLIYLIQKKFYNQRAVMMRALKNGHCPHCSLKILPTMNNCPVCGYHLKTKCEACNNMSMQGGAYCEVCGSKRQRTESA
jgi:hypothetical protein